MRSVSLLSNVSTIQVQPTVNNMSSDKTDLHKKIGATFLLISFLLRSLLLISVTLGTPWASREWITWEHILHPILDLIFGIGLWCNWRYFKFGAILWAGLVVIVVWVKGWIQGPFGFPYFSLIPQSTLLFSLLIVLFGNSTRGSIIRAMTVFAIGYLGAFLFALCMVLFFRLS